MKILRYILKTFLKSQRKFIKYLLVSGTKWSQNINTSTNYTMVQYRLLQILIEAILGLSLKDEWSLLFYIVLLFEERTCECHQ